MSRGTVGNRAKHGEHERQAAIPDPLAGPIERCPGCGAKVAMPCRACARRAALAGTRETFDGDATPEATIQLTDEERERWLALQVKKRAADAEHEEPPVEVKRYWNQAEGRSRGLPVFVPTEEML